MSAQPPTDPGPPWSPSGPNAPVPPGPYAPAPQVPPAAPVKPKRRLAPILGGAVGAIVAAAVFIALRSGSDNMPSVDKWTTFSDPGGRFTVAMPKQPDRTTQQVPAGTVTLEVISYTASYSDSGVVVGYTDYPAELDLGAPGDVLDGAVQGAAQATSGTVVSSTPTTVAGRPAIDSEIQSDKGRALSRFVLDGHRMYLLTTAAKGSRSDIHRQLTDTFKLTGS